MEQKRLHTGIVDLSRCDSSFQRQVDELSGEKVGLCFHCRTCAGGCPFITAMDYPPHGVLRLVQLGLHREALECSTIWICVACNTCSIQCPMAIDIAAIMDALRHMALREGAKIAEPEILEFHKEVINSMERYGRTHKLEIMLRYKLRMHQWFQDMDIGLKMLAKRKLDLTPSRVKGIGELRDLFVFPEPEKDVGNA
jgi:heterodisulfide reductase subunit C